MNLKGSILIEQLDELIRSSEDNMLWKQVLHLLGRLCSWVRASRYIVLTYKDFREHLRDAQVLQADKSPFSTTDFQLPWRNTSAILGGVLPEFQESLLQDALQARQNDKALSSILQWLSSMIDGTFNPNLHAEIALLLHFHLRGLEFIAGDRYIGCSKPSCYCCDLYLRSHPARILPRRCHGNIWVKWTVPELNAVIVPQQADILREMVNYVKSDLRCQIMSGPVHGGRPADSTTGLGTTEPPSESPYDVSRT